jgi:hypothetical protein
MKKQTAVQEFNWWVNWELESLLDGTLGYDEFKKQLEAKFLEAIAIEKEQIIDAFVECWKANMPDGYECKQSAEQYYNETYGN